MARLISAAAGWPAVYFLLSLICIPANALHFYMQGGQPKCFFEELPKDTLTVGKTPPTARSPRLTLPKGHYEVQQYNVDAKEFQPDSSVGLYITVDQVFDNDHRIVQQKGESKGRFTFTAGESGEHKLCFSPTNFKHQAGHLKNGQEVGGVRVSLDMVVGATSNIESTDHGKIQDMVGKVRELQGRLQDIRREQVFQRVSSGGRFGRAALTEFRSARRSSEISPRLRMREWFDGRWFSWRFWGSFARGSCRTSGRSSSSRS
jgi:hypothetical protein